MGKRVLMNGNEALGEGAIRGGCDCYFGYPITPQNELTAYMAVNMPQREKVFVQAESEVAAINMVYGGAAAGKRAMTSSSSPGISLKQEGISYMAGAQLPGLIVNVQRAGPGLGDIQPSQADYFQAVKGGGHGDYRLLVLAPASVQETHDFAAQSFDLADKYRMPVMILTDGRLGQMMEPFELWEGKIETFDKPWALIGAKGRSGNAIHSYWGQAPGLEIVNLALQEKYRLIEKEEVRFDTYKLDDAELMLVAYGTSARLCREAVDLACADGIKAGLLRPITLWPFPSREISARLARMKKVLTVEMSAGQMVEDVRLAVNGAVPVEFYGRLGGAVMTVREIYEKIKAIA